MNISMFLEKQTIDLLTDDDISELQIFLDSHWKSNFLLFLDGALFAFSKRNLDNLEKIKKGKYIINMFSIYHQNPNGSDDTEVISLNLIE